MMETDDLSGKLEDAGYEIEYRWDGNILYDDTIFTECPGDYSREFLEPMARLGEEFFDVDNIDPGYDETDRTYDVNSERPLIDEYVEFTLDGTSQRIEFTDEDYYGNVGDRTSVARFVDDVNDVLHDQGHERCFVLAIVGEQESMPSVSVRLVLVADSMLAQLLELDAGSEHAVEILNADGLRSYALEDTGEQPEDFTPSNVAAEARAELTEALEAAERAGELELPGRRDPELREKLLFSSGESTLETCRNSESFRPLEPLAERDMLVWFDGEGEFFQRGRHADLTDYLLRMVSVDAEVSDRWVDDRGWVISAEWDDESVHISQEEERERPSDFVEIGAVLTLVRAVLHREELEWEVVPLDPKDQTVLLTVVPKSLAETLRDEPLFDVLEPVVGEPARELRSEEMSALDLE